MYNKLVKDLMIPVDQFPTINQNASMFDAMLALKNANEKRSETQEPFRAVLITNAENKVVGKIGLLGFLRALEPNYNSILDIDKLSRFALSSGYIESMIQQFNLWKSDPSDLKKIADNVKAKEIMTVIEQRIEQNETISSAIHKIIMWQTVSILVSDNKEIVGILRLKDLYLSIEDYIINYNNNK